MNPAYCQARFRAELPHGGLPDAFGVVTAWNPDGMPCDEGANEAANRLLREAVDAAGCAHFPVTGGSPDFRHAEPGFGIVAPAARCLEWGREFRQEAVFWVERGEVNLVSCQGGPGRALGRWSDRATGAAARPAFHFRGPADLVDLPATAFLCSTRCPGDRILAAYDWARRQCDEGGAVIGGFHTPVEKDVLAILARRDARILWVPARDLPRRIPSTLQPAFAEGRLLVLSPFDPGSLPRPTRESCSLRNRFVLARAADRFIPHVAAGSALARDLGQGCGGAGVLRC